MRNYSFQCFSAETLETLDQQVTEMVNTNSFTNRQLIGLLYDSSNIGLINPSILQLLYQKLSNQTEYFLIDDYKQILQSIKSYKYETFEDLLNKVYAKAKIEIKNTGKIKDILEIIKSTVLISLRNYNNVNDEFTNYHAKLLINKTHLLTELDIYQILVIQTYKKTVFSESFMNIITKKIKDNLKYDSKRRSALFLTNVLDISQYSENVDTELIKLIYDEIISRMSSQSADQAGL